MTVPYTWLYIQQAAGDQCTYLLGIEPETHFEVSCSVTNLNITA